MRVEGKITIDIERESSSGERTVNISSDRPTNIANFLTGKTPAEAIEILPLIFNICGQAHKMAAMMACGHGAHAAGMPLVVLCENAREHVLRILTGWHGGEAPNLSAMPTHKIMRLVAQMEQALSIDAAAVDAVADQLDDFLTTHIFGISPDEWRSMADEGQIVEWASLRATPAASYIADIYQNNWQGFGACTPHFLPVLDPEELCASLLERDGEAFAARPQWQGKPCETGALARCDRHPLVASVARKFGHGLLARQAARLMELAEIPAKIRRENRTNGDDNAADITRGFGQVETARGRLIHAAIIENGTIRAYRIVAPTEWNFHPEGVVKQSIQSLPEAESAQLTQLSGMIVDAIDPCVAYQVRVH